MKILDLTGEDLSVTHSINNSISSGSKFGRKIGDGTGQVVYEIAHNSSESVLKVLYPQVEEQFPTFNESEFSRIEFYYQALEAIGSTGIQLPDSFDVLELSFKDDIVNRLAFTQSFIDHYDDDGYDILPDIGVMTGYSKKEDIGKTPKATRGCFYRTSNGENIFADWDKYLSSIGRVGEKMNIKTNKELSSFCNLIRESGKNV